jgi:hypothetical protein
MKRETSVRSQTGQALILLALAFIGLAAFAGLTIDAGILFSHIGHLRRAVDAASLAAAGQFREGRSAAELSAMALQVIELNGLDASSAIAMVCDRELPGSDYDDPRLCPGGENPPPATTTESYRKFVRVQAQLPVNFAFLPIIGWSSVTIQANAISEAASVDIVLAIDTSESMAFDGGSEFLRDPDNCNPIDDCHPFEEVRENAKLLVERTYFPYDRVGLVTFDREATLELALEDGTTEADVLDALDAMQVYSQPPCLGWDLSGDPRGCTSTNIADGLRFAGTEFCKDKNGNSNCDSDEMREEAVWIVVLLTDGAANAALNAAAPPIDPGRWLCPGSLSAPTWVQPFCRDEEFEIGPGEYGFDAEDAAEAMGYFAGCPDPDLEQKGGCVAVGGGQGAVVFTIGLGDLVTNNATCDPVAYPGGCEEDSGEKLLRYIAAVGDDGDPTTDDCDGVGTGNSCGNYYFAEEGFELEAVFEAIASRIFTRITH